MPTWALTRGRICDSIIFPLESWTVTSSLMTYRKIDPISRDINKLKLFNYILEIFLEMDLVHKIHKLQVPWKLYQVHMNAEMPSLVAGKDENIVNYGYIGTSILRIYRQIFWKKISISLKLIKIYKKIQEKLYKNIIRSIINILKLFY